MPGLDALCGSSKCAVSSLCTDLTEFYFSATPSGGGTTVSTSGVPGVRMGERCYCCQLPPRMPA